MIEGQVASEPVFVPGGRVGQHLAAYRAVDRVELTPHSLLIRKKDRLVMMWRGRGRGMPRRG
jgi:hypothetical protein